LGDLGMHSGEHELRRMDAPEIMKPNPREVRSQPSPIIQKVRHNL